MTVPNGSTVRLAYVNEVTIGTTPATPAFKNLRYVTADPRPKKQTEIPKEVRADGNITSIVDVGRSVDGNLTGHLAYGDSDDLIASVLRNAWSTNVMVNGVSSRSITLEGFFNRGGSNAYARHRGVRVNTWDLTVEARKPVDSVFGIMGLGTTYASSAISGATYAAEGTTEIFNGGSNFESFAITGITNSPVIKKITMRANSNLTQVDAAGQYEPYSHLLGLLEITGTISAYFENQDVVDAVVGHTTVGLGWTLADAAGNSYDFSIPSAKLLDGGPSMPGNGQAVMVEIPYQAQYNSGISGQIQITRTAA